MASITTSKFRKAVADSFFDDIFSRRNKYYHYFGKSSSSELPLNPGNPGMEKIEYQATVKNNIVAAKRIFSSDVSYVVPRINWTSGAFYAKYSTAFDGNFESPPTGDQRFYVYNESNDSVYICIENANEGASTSIPDSTEPYVVTYSDGYAWKYMYTIPTSMKDKFLTDSYIPVFNALNAQYYSGGGISEVAILDSGSGYDQSSASISVSGDGSGAVLLPVIVDGKLADVIIKNPGANYTQVGFIVNGSSSNQAKLSAELASGNLESSQALVELLATPGTIESAEVVEMGDNLTTGLVAKVIGDGKGATLQVILGSGADSDRLSRLVVSNKGSGYTWAKVEFTGSGSHPTARLNVSPAYGLGKDAISDLFASTLMVYGKIDRLGFPDYFSDVDVTYNNYGIIKNIRNYESTPNIHNQVSKNRYQCDVAIEPKIQFVGGGGVGAKGVAVVTGKHVSGVFIQDPGAGYQATPNLSVVGGGGSGATAIAKLDAVVSGATLTYGGVGYNMTPGVSLASTSGDGARATATIGLGVGAIAITNQGSGYVTAPTISFSGGTGSGATAIAEISGGKVVKITVTNPGSYTAMPTVSFSGGAAAGTVIPTYSVNGISVESAGSGYEGSPEVSFSGSCGIKDVVVNDSGESFASGDNSLSLSFSGGGGSGATAVAYINDCVREISLTDGGSGFTLVPTVTISGGSGSGATAIAEISGGKVVAIKITNRGSGYTGTPPTVTIVPSGSEPVLPTTATATASVARGITHINVTNPGSGYASTPSITVPVSGTRSGFSLTPIIGTATATTSILGSVKEVILTSSGSGYTSNPTITSTGGAPISAAIMYSKVVGEISGITVVDEGSGYTSQPKVIITGGEGSGASYVANLNDTGKVISCTKIKGGNNYVITKYADFPVGSVLEDELGNEFTIHSSKVNKDQKAFILQSNDGASLFGGQKLRVKNQSSYFITQSATSHKLIETIFPIACYKVRGSFLSAGDSFANGDELVLADATNGDKKFIVIHQRVIEGNTEFLLSSINGGELNINATLTSNAKQFKVLSFDEPEIDKRSGDILVMSGYTNFSQNDSRVSTIRTILSFAECVDSGV